VIYVVCHLQRWRRSNTRSLDFTEPTDVFCLDMKATVVNLKVPTEF